ncbi:hypothetical protein D3C87_1631440 [compost metagenome]
MWRIDDQAWGPCRVAVENQRDPGAFRCGQAFDLATIDGHVNRLLRVHDLERAGHLGLGGKGQRRALAYPDLQGSIAGIDHPYPGGTFGQCGRVKTGDFRGGLYPCRDQAKTQPQKNSNVHVSPQ